MRLFTKRSDERIKYSIVAPVYNTGKYLERCVNSVINQTYGNWELILVDDGSTDKKTIEICDYYANKDERIRVVHKENEGQLLTRRCGMKMSKGDYIYCLDSDDHINKDLLKYVNAVIEKKDADVVIFRFYRMGAKLHKYSKKLFNNNEIFTKQNNDVLIRKYLSTYELNNMCNKVIKRSIADLDGDYSNYKGIKHGEDKLQSAAILFAAEKICYLNKALYYYEQNPDSITQVKISENKYKGIISGSRATMREINKRIDQYYKERTIYKKMSAAHCIETNFRILNDYIATLKPDDIQVCKVVGEFQEDQDLFQIKELIDMNYLNKSTGVLWSNYCNGTLLDYMKKSGQL